MSSILKTAMAMVGCFSLVACSQSALVKSSQTSIPSLRYSPNKGDVSQTVYSSVQFEKQYEADAIRSSKTEMARFVTESEVVQLGLLGQESMVDLKTVEKEGSLDLTGIGFPQENETIRYVFDSNYRVLHAGRYPKGSLFYLPPVFLPEGEVSIGDSWSNKASWVGLTNGVPLTIELVSILKNIYECKKEDLCVEIEISGHVDLDSSEDTKEFKLRSLIKGRFLIRVFDGVILWSQVNSEEDIITAKKRFSSISCLSSFLKNPDNWVSPNVSDYDLDRPCDPKSNEAQPLPL